MTVAMWAYGIATIAAGGVALIWYATSRPTAETQPWTPGVRGRHAATDPYPAPRVTPMDHDRREPAANHTQEIPLPVPPVVTGVRATAPVPPPQDLWWWTLPADSEATALIALSVPQPRLEDGDTAALRRDVLAEALAQAGEVA